MTDCCGRFRECDLLCSICAAGKTDGDLSDVREARPTLHSILSAKGEERDRVTGLKQVRMIMW